MDLTGNEKFWKALEFVKEFDGDLSKEVMVYWKEYWFPIHGDDLPFPWAIAAFDSAINHGVSKTNKWLPQVTSWRKLISLRRIFYLDSIKKDPFKAKYKEQWMSRLNALDKFISFWEDQQS